MTNREGNRTDKDNKPKRKNENIRRCNQIGRINTKNQGAQNKAVNKDKKQ